MEPKLPSPNRGPESHSASPVHNGEVVSRHYTHETDPGRSVEYGDSPAETAPAAEATHAPAVALPVPPVTVASDDDTAVSLPQVQSDAPAIASDSELIEKEWVDKAKKLIAETKDDPYRREQEVIKLQSEYLFKRYGRKLGSPQ